MAAGTMANCNYFIISSSFFLIYIYINFYFSYRFFRYLRNVSIEGDLNKPNIEFTADGDLKSAELKIMNLRPSANNKNLVWEEVNTSLAPRMIIFKIFYLFIFFLFYFY